MDRFETQIKKIKNSNNLSYVIVITALFSVATYLYFLGYLYNGTKLISLKNIPVHGDFYRQYEYAQILFNQPYEFINKFVNWYRTLPNPDEILFLDGPIYLFMIGLTELSATNTKSYWTTNFIFVVINSFFILYWLSSIKNLNIVVSLCLVLSPHFMYYSFIGGSDLLFCCFAFGAFLFLNPEHWANPRKKFIHLGCILLLLAVMTRPNGVLLFFFAIYAIQKNKFLSLEHKTSIYIFLFIVFNLGLLYYLPYAHAYITSSVAFDRTVYEGINSSLLDNIFYSNADFQERFVIIFKIFLLKILSMVGINLNFTTIVSYKILSFLFGLVFLIGFFRIIFAKGFLLEKFFIIPFILPFIGYVNIRFTLPFLPITFFYGITIAIPIYIISKKYFLSRIKPAK